MQPRSDHCGPVTRSAFRRKAALVLAAGLCLTAIIAIWALVSGHFDATEVRVLGSTLAASLFTLGGLVGAMVLERSDRRRTLGQATILLSAIDLALVLVVIWSHSESETFLRALGVGLALLPACAHGCLMLGRLSPRDGRAVRALSSAAVGFAATPAVLVAGTMVFASGPIDEALWRVLGVLVVLAVLATLLTPIARRLTSKGEPRENRTQLETTVAPPGDEPPRASLMIDRLATGN